MKVIKWPWGDYTVNGQHVVADTLNQTEINQLDDIVREQNRSHKPKRKRRSTTRRSSGSGSRYPSKRTNYAAQVVSRNHAMAELVERVNDVTDNQN